MKMKKADIKKELVEAGVCNKKDIVYIDNTVSNDILYIAIIVIGGCLIDRYTRFTDGSLYKEETNFIDTIDGFKLIKTL